MNTVVFSGFVGLNKVQLDRGFKNILGVRLNEASDLTDRLLKFKTLELKAKNNEQVSQLVQLAKQTNAEVEVT